MLNSELLQSIRDLRDLIEDLLDDKPETREEWDKICHLQAELAELERRALAFRNSPPHF